MSRPVIEAVNLCKEYVLTENPGSLRDLADQAWRRLRGEEIRSERFQALQDISLTVKKGESFGVLGKNGSGKSTLLKILSKITLPTSGRA
jgi:lipopolysaccharide transport system ATP-binding protein